MPTPVQHLAIACDLLTRIDLPAAVRRRLEAHWGAHLLGQVAPDAQNASGQSREATHFFTLPPCSTLPPAHVQMLTAHPSLAKASALEPAQAVFAAGYMAHLLVDEMWIRQVFSPYFGPDAPWGTLHERLLIHNVLRAWMDQRDLARLAGNESQMLDHTYPDGWLPFLADGALCAWRDEIARQLQPGAAMRTVHVFAARAQISPAEFDHLLNTPGEAEHRVFAHVSRECVLNFGNAALRNCRDLIITYLEDRLCT